MLIQSLKNQFLKGLGYLAVGVSILFLVLILSPLPNSKGEYARLVEYSLMAVGIFYTLYRYPRYNVASWVVVIHQTLSHLIWFEPQIRVFGSIQIYHMFTYPMLVMFLIGRLWGGIFCLGLLLCTAALLPLHQWDLSIYGPKGQMFLMVFSIIIILAYFIQRFYEAFMQRIAAVAEKDGLTGLPNRAGFMLRLEAAIQRARPFYLVMMDMDNFRRINLIRGSQKADNFLIEVANLLRQRRDGYDVARHYGDEFVWIFERPMDRLEDEVAFIQQGLLDISKSPEISIAITASFGATRFPQDAHSARDLWSQAELAVKKAKQEGRKKLRVFQPSDADRERWQGDLLGRLENALDRKDLQVHFQPKIDTVEERICGMEALVRWVDHGVYISPTDFIPLAEQNGLVHSIGRLVLEKSICFVSLLHQEGFNDMSVSVNVSPAQLMQDGLVDDVVELCIQYGVSPGLVYLEITEGVLLHQGVNDVLSGLKKAGFKLSLDDFGTGFSSLSYLTQYCFDELKVDKSFTDGIFRSQRDMYVFRAVLTLANLLEMEAVVEGVESRKQLDLLEQGGVMCVQGWFFASAMPEDKFRQYLYQFDFCNAKEIGKKE